MHLPKTLLSLTDQMFLDKTGNTPGLSSQSASVRSSTLKAVTMARMVFPKSSNVRISITTFRSVFNPYSGVPCDWVNVFRHP